MSIIIQIGPSHLTTSSSVAPHPACIVEAETTLDMGPDLEYDAEAPVTSVDTPNVSLSTSVTTNHSRKEVRTAHHASHGFASCFGLPYQDHNYGAPPPPSPPQSPLPKVNGTIDDDTSFSVISTSTNNEDDTQEESITRCICGFDHDDEYMICCDRCSVWQHVDCMGLNQSNIPDTYLCEKCEPRKVDRQKAKALQTRKKEAMTDSTTDDSGEEENSVCHSTALQTDSKAIKLRKRRKDGKGVNKSEIGLVMKRYKVNKERVERTRTGIRRKTKSESTSTADEEAQDAWESILSEWSFKYEEALTNQYTPEVQLLAGSLGTRNNDTVRNISEQLLAQLCKVVDISGKKRLVAAVDIPANQVITEYKGKFLSATHFCEQNPIFNNRLYPYVLFFKMDKHSDICVDAREYGNEARFVRRSYTPNAEVKPLVNSGVLHTYLFSLKEIKKDEEITISYDHSYAECSSERRKKSKKASVDNDNDSNQASVIAGNSVISSSPCKSQKYSPIKSVNYQSTPISHSMTSADSTLEYNRVSQEENDTDEQSAERRKMTREERKIDAIMRAFERMEKTAKRRQQALERMAQQKAQLQKQDSEKDSPDVLEGISDQIVEEDGSNLQPVEITCNEELKASLITCQNNAVQGCRHRKGKRRRGSGTPGRRRTRSNSGGSDILSPDELTPVVVNPPSLNLTVSPTNPTTCVSTTCSSVSPGATASNNNNTFPKTKKFLMQEWLQEKAETSVPVSCPLTIHTELSWSLSTASPTCYVRCTRDSPNVGGISSAHLRRNSTSGLSLSTKPSSLGSAKKRWLRQAMCESGTSEVDCSNFESTMLEGGPNSPIHNGCFSPNPHSDASSPCLSPPGDIVTPLKKRRLMRESLESMSSPRSPSPTAPIGWPASISSIESPEHSNSALEEQFLHLSNEEKTLQTAVKREDEVSIANSGQSGLELSESVAANSTEQWTVKEESSDMEPTSSSGINQDPIVSNEKHASPNASDILSVNATASDSSQDSSCLDLTCHDERESHVSSSESTVPTNRFQNNANLQPVNNVSSSTLNDNNEVTSTNKELNPVEDDKDSLPDSSLDGEVELGNRLTEPEVCSVQQDQPLGKPNSTNDCVTSSHFVNTINDKQASSSSFTMPQSSIKSAQTLKSPVRVFPAVSSGSNSIGISSCSSLVSSSVSHKRKVSLSEYRMRMREQASSSETKITPKTPDNSPTKTDETFNVQDPSSTMCPPKFLSSSKIVEKASSRKKDCINEEYQSGELDVRWNNDQLEVTSEQEMQSEADSPENLDSAKECAKSQDQNTLLAKSVSNPSSILHMCAQQPPPPPPLPSSSSSNSTKPNAVPQFRYPPAQPYCRQPFVVGQVSSPFVALPPSLSPTLPAQASIHVMHHPTHILPPPPPPPIIPVPQVINPPAAPAFPTPPPPQNGYNSVVSSQNFIPSPIPQSYHYNQGLFK